MVEVNMVVQPTAYRSPADFKKGDNIAATSSGVGAIEAATADVGPLVRNCSGHSSALLQSYNVRVELIDESYQYHCSIRCYYFRCYCCRCCYCCCYFCYYYEQLFHCVCLLACTCSTQREYDYWLHRSQYFFFTKPINNKISLIRCRRMMLPNLVDLNADYKQQVTLTLIGIVGATYLLYQLLKRYSDESYPPGPSTLPILGNLHQVALCGNMINFLEKNRRLYGNVRKCCSP